MDRFDFILDNENVFNKIKRTKFQKECKENAKLSIRNIGFCPKCNEQVYESSNYDLVCVNHYLADRFGFNGTKQCTYLVRREDRR